MKSVDSPPPGWDTAAFWLAAIRDARAEPNSILANLKITQLHHSLSQALARVLAPAEGPNFHTWAVWGSRKAGVTVRQEDLDSAISGARSRARRLLRWNHRSRDRGVESGRRIPAGARGQSHRAGGHRHTDRALHRGIRRNRGR